MKLLVTPVLLLLSISVLSQSAKRIPLMRMIFHDDIVRTQQRLDQLDGAADHNFSVTNKSSTATCTAYLYDTVNKARFDIEADSTLNVNGKIKYLRGLNEVLTGFYFASGKADGVSPGKLPLVISLYLKAAALDKKEQSIISLAHSSRPEVLEVVLNTGTFRNNEGFAESKAIVFARKLEKAPEDILPALQRDPNNASADSLIKKIAYIDPESVYAYVQVNDNLSQRIAQNPDSLVQTIYRLANMNTGRLYFPFLDNLYRNKVTMQQIEESMGDKYKYFRLLVNTDIDYAGRLNRGDTPVELSSLYRMIKSKAVDGFINVINGLHNAPDHVRMREVEPLNAQELYFLCVMGDPEIYTSSYLKVYSRIFERLKVARGDSLLALVNYDYFKKFIKMAAGYNTLDHFLSTMSKQSAQELMRSFAANLEKTTNLENAVDVADSYASISNPSVRGLILDVTKNSYQQLLKTNNQRGITIYEILNSIFESLNPAAKIDLSAKYGIPTVYSLSNSSLRGPSGRLVVQQFFFGDKDGFTEFANFKAAYRNANWRTVDRGNWIETSSVSGIPVTIYSNKPLSAIDELDGRAQAQLCNYLSDHNLQPTVVIHRGHSYYVKFTIQQLAPTARLVLLGSCGGYHNIGGVLNIAPTAHIIASKQVGSGSINQPMIVNITDDLRRGKNLNWPQKWQQFVRLFGTNDRFDDYIPPHKNLGAIFIMAYKQKFGEQGS